MSMQITIDRSKLLQLPPHESNYVSGGTASLYYERGWFKYHAAGGYPKFFAKINPIPVQTIDQSSILILMGTYRIVDLFDAYLFFIEPRPGDAAHVFGFYLNSDGRITIRSYNTPTPVGNYSTEMSVGQGDVVLLKLLVINDGGSIYFKAVAGKYDWQGDSYTKYVDAYAQPAALTNWRYWVLIEADGVEGRILVGPHAVQWGNTIYGTYNSDINLNDVRDMVRQAKAMGLADPSTVDLDF